MSAPMTLREMVDALYELAREHQRPGLDPDVLQAHPVNHPLPRQLELARQHLGVALQLARLAVKPKLHAVTEDPKA